MRTVYTGSGSKSHHTGIETHYEGGIDANLETPNRTILELKRLIDVNGTSGIFSSKSHHTGIETDFRFSKAAFNQAPNRTILELKLSTAATTLVSFMSPNRTILELKLMIAGDTDAIRKAPNRTILELKLHYT